MTAHSSPGGGLAPNHRTAPRFNKVMIIDDSEIDLEVENIIMKSINLAKTIDLRLSARDVIKDLSSVRRLDEVPDLIFLDLNMPEMSGLEFLNAFSTLPEFVQQKCNIVIVTSTNDNKTIDLTYTNPSVVDYIVKPLDVVRAKKFLTYENPAR